MASEKAISRKSKMQVMQGCKANTTVDERDGLLKELADRAWAGARPPLWEQQDLDLLLDLFRWTTRPCPPLCREASGRLLVDGGREDLQH